MEPLWRFRGSEIPSSGTPTQFIVKWEDPSMENSDEPLIHDQFEFRHADTPVCLVFSAGQTLTGGGYPHLSSPARWTTAGARGGWGHTAPREASAMLAERYAACAGAPARARGSCRAGGRAGPSSAFGRVPRCAARFETTASGHAVRSVTTRATGPVVDAAFGVEGGPHGRYLFRGPLS